MLTERSVHPWTERSTHHLPPPGRSRPRFRSTPGRWDARAPTRPCGSAVARSSRLRARRCADGRASPLPTASFDILRAGSRERLATPSSVRRHDVCPESSCRTGSHSSGRTAYGPPNPAQSRVAAQMPVSLQSLTPWIALEAPSRPSQRVDLRNAVCDAILRWNRAVETVKGETVTTDGVDRVVCLHCI